MNYPYFRSLLRKSCLYGNEFKKSLTSIIGRTHIIAIINYQLSIINYQLRVYLCLTPTGKYSKSPVGFNSTWGV